uniref:Uncharacterized protein n=1 Tax=Oryza glumipatula TaxID=40148 RepID=A0A0D9Z445_9ORYZ
MARVCRRRTGRVPGGAATGAAPCRTAARTPAAAARPLAAELVRCALAAAAALLASPPLPLRSLARHCRSAQPAAHSLAAAPLPSVGRRVLIRLLGSSPSTSYAMSRRRRRQRRHHRRRVARRRPRRPPLPPASSPPADQLAQSGEREKEGREEGCRPRHPDIWGHMSPTLTKQPRRIKSGLKSATTSDKIRVKIT